MGSRARVAAAAWLVVSGLLVGGCTATAFADPGQIASDGTADRTTDDASSSPVRQSDTGTSRGDPALDNDDSGADDNDDARVDRGEPDPSAGRDGAEPGARDENRVDDPKADGEPNTPPSGDLEVSGRDQEGEKLPLPPCSEKGAQDCGPWWPWPWPWPEPDPDDAPKSDNDGGFPRDLPESLPFPAPSIGLPPEFQPPMGEPLYPDLVDTVPGVGVAGSGSPGAPVSVPVLVIAPTGGGAGPGLPAAPRQATAEPAPARQPPPATTGSKAALPASSHRVGYGEYLRTAGLSQIVMAAVPGLAGILILSGVGGLVGYRQAKAGHAMRTSGIARYMN